jgi:mannonate dehydratase
MVHWRDEVLEVFPGAPVTKNGYMFVNEAPGLGIDIDEAAAAKHPLPEFNYNWTQVRKADGTPVRP